MVMLIFVDNTEKILAPMEFFVVFPRNSAFILNIIETSGVDLARVSSMQ